MAELYVILIPGDFFDAIDSDNIEKVKKLMRLAGVDAETIRIVLMKIHDNE